MTDSLKGDGRAIFTIFIGVIIAIVFIASFSSSIFTQTNTASETNLSITVPAINVTTAVNGRDLISATTISNATNISLITHGLLLGDGIVNGVKTVTIVVNDSEGGLVGTTVNLTYTYNPDGYIGNAGGRSIAALITILSALAIVVFVIVVLFQFGSLGVLSSFRGRRKD